jgi:hypothetical protein
VVPQEIFATPPRHEVVFVPHHLAAVIVVKSPHPIVAVNHQVVRILIPRADERTPGGVIKPIVDAVFGPVRLFG